MNSAKNYIFNTIYPQKNRNITLFLATEYYHYLSESGLPISRIVNRSTTHKKISGLERVVKMLKLKDLSVIVALALGLILIGANFDLKTL